MNSTSSGYPKEAKSVSDAAIVMTNCSQLPKSLPTTTTPWWELPNLIFSEWLRITKKREKFATGTNIPGILSLIPIRTAYLPIRFPPKPHQKLKKAPRLKNRTIWSSQMSNWMTQKLPKLWAPKIKMTQPNPLMTSSKSMSIQLRELPSEIFKLTM